MALDRAFGEEERLGDLGVGQALRRPGQDLALAVGEGRAARRWRAGCGAPPTDRCRRRGRRPPGSTRSRGSKTRASAPASRARRTPVPVARRRDDDDRRLRRARGAAGAGRPSRPGGRRRRRGRRSPRRRASSSASSASVARRSPARSALGGAFASDGGDPPQRASGVAAPRPGGAGRTQGHGMLVDWLARRTAHGTDNGAGTRNVCGELRSIARKSLRARVAAWGDDRRDDRHPATRRRTASSTTSSFGEDVVVHSVHQPLRLPDRRRHRGSAPSSRSSAAP